ncbi:MAG TPA: DUF6801 domain-containing protein [Acidimicrobiales bacterium]|nr:DUF6801 domain-containing protein [Acidimicrobiales bacterium]
MRNRLAAAALRVAVSGSLAGIAAASLAVGLAEGSSGAAPASSVSATVPYNCNIAGLLHETLDIGVAETAPASVTPGGSVDLTGFQTTTVVPANLVTLLIDFLHITTFSGTVTGIDVDATGATPATINAAPKAGYPFTVKVTSGKAATIVIPATPITVGPFTAGKSGSVSVSPSTVTITTKIGKSVDTITCAPPKTLPSAAVAHIAIVAATTTTAAPTTTTLAPTTTAPVTPTTVPPPPTGEPWSGAPYWLIVGMAALLGLGAFERAVRIRRRST